MWGQMPTSMDGGRAMQLDAAFMDIIRHVGMGDRNMQKLSVFSRSDKPTSNTVACVLFSLVIPQSERSANFSLSKPSRMWLMRNCCVFIKTLCTVSLSNRASLRKSSCVWAFV